jgi:predicted transcriptional regulator
VFLRIKRGYFYLALWGTVYFVSLMLMAMSITSRLPYELALTCTGVLGGLVGDAAFKHFLGKRTMRQLETADAAGSNHDLIMNHVEQNGRITTAECQQVTGLKDTQATHVLVQLVKDGELEQVGKGRSAYYRKKGSNS